MTRVALASAALALAACHDRAPAPRRAQPPSPVVQTALVQAMQGAVAAAERGRALERARRPPPAPPAPDQADVASLLGNAPDVQLLSPGDRQALDALVDQLDSATRADLDSLAGPGGLDALGGGTITGPGGLGALAGSTTPPPEVELTLQSDIDGLEADAVADATADVRAVAERCARSAAEHGRLTDRAQAMVTITALDHGVSTYVSGDAVLTGCLRGLRLPSALPPGTTLTYQLTARPR